MIRTDCRGCGSQKGMESILLLGNHIPSNKLLNSRWESSQSYPLELVQCHECELLQVGYDVPHVELFDGSYPYYSANGGAGWLKHSADFAEHMQKRLGLNHDSDVLEIGSNDGTTLSSFQIRSCHAQGVDPAAGPAATANGRGIPTVCAPFGLSKWTPDRAQDLIYGMNVLAHVPDPNDMLAGVARSLDYKATAVFEFPWVAHTIRLGHFDQVYHEHYSYFSVGALAHIAAKHDLCVYDVEHLTTHGGSVRVYLCRNGDLPVTDAVAMTYSAELRMLDKPEVRKFQIKARRARARFSEWIESETDVLAYGAAAKGNTFLNYCGVTFNHIPFVGDTTPAKFGKFLPMSGIEIMPEAAIIYTQPKYLLVLPHNWKHSIIARLRLKMPSTTFVTALPELEFVRP